MDFIRHMRRSAFSLGRPGGLITEITWKAGKTELICLHGGLRFPYIGRMGKYHLPFWCDGRKRIHAVKSAIHAIGVRLFPVFYDIKSESQRRWIL